MTRVELCGDLLWGEAPRPCGDEIWLSDTQAGQLVRISPEGIERRDLDNPTNGLWFLPDGRLAAAVWTEKRIDVLVDGAFMPYSDLSHLVRDRLGDMTGTPDGRLYVDDMGPNPHSGEPVGRVLVIDSDGSARVAADGLRFPNGLAVIGNVLVVAETHAARLTAFDIQDDGMLANRRTWSDLAALLSPAHRPDGIWPIADGSVWVATTGAAEFVRVEGERVLERIPTPGEFAVACCVHDGELYLSTSRSLDPELDFITEAIPRKQIRGRLTRLLVFSTSPTPLPKGTSMFDSEVIILGAGTTGLATAKLLADDGVSVTIVDPFRIAALFPRATHIDDETMRIFQTLGAAHLEPAFLKHTGRYEFFNAYGQLLQAMPWRSEPTNQGWYGDYQFFQPDFENFLRGRLQAAPTAELRFGWRAIAVEQTEDGATVTIRNERTGEEQALTSRYVVGADGARSLVRDAVSPEVTDFQATHRSLILDIAVTNPLAVPHVSTFTATSRNAVTVVPGPGGNIRFEFLLRPEDETVAFEEPALWYGLLEPYLAPGDYRILRADVYKWQSVLPHNWRKGRLLLAGDAAHQMTPHLGQGMCSGLRDASNLAWKLAAVLHGAPDALLDTYQSERAPHVTVYIQAAAGAANAVEYLSMNAGELGDAPALRETPFPLPVLGSGVHGDTDEVAGALSIQPRLLNGNLMDDTIGYGFAVIGDASVVNAVDAATAETWACLGVTVITEVGLPLRSWLHELNVHAVIVRPDRYVLGGAVDAAGLEQLTARLEAAIGAGAVVAQV